MVKDINWLNWAILFVLYFAFDLFYTRYVRAIQKSEALKGANFSVAILLLGFYGTVSYVDNYVNIVPIIVGTYLGSYVSIRWTKA